MEKRFKVSDFFIRFLFIKDGNLDLRGIGGLAHEGAGVAGTRAGLELRLSVALDAHEAVGLDGLDEQITHASVAADTCDK